MFPAHVPVIYGYLQEEELCLSALSLSPSLSPLFPTPSDCLMSGTCFSLPRPLLVHIRCALLSEGD